jgi:hypothetical protein
MPRVLPDKAGLFSSSSFLVFKKIKELAGSYHPTAKMTALRLATIAIPVDRWQQRDLTPRFFSSE